MDFTRLLALQGGDELEALLDTSISYTSATGTPALRAAIANLEGVEPDAAGGDRSLRGPADPLFLAAEPGANVVLQSRFPANQHWPESLWDRRPLL